MILGRGKQGVKYAKILGMSNDEAFAYQRRFFGLAPEIPAWQQATRERLLAGETLQTTFGRVRRLPVEVFQFDEKAKIDALNECLAFVPQSTLSDFCLSALCVLVEEAHQVRISIHDALVGECHRDAYDRTADRFATVMRRSAEQFTTAVPFPVDVKVGQNWGELG